MADDWYESPRGWVATFRGFADLDPRPLSGQRVMVDGRSYTVLGVETFAISNATGQPFGLLVGERFPTAEALRATSDRTRT